MAKRGVKRRRGRSQVALFLLGFLMVAGAVIARRSYGYARSRELVELETERSRLAADRSRLVTDIRNAMSLGRLAPIATQRLGMRVPSDSQVIRLPRPARRGGG
jgi:cell division protein FtsL